MPTASIWCEFLRQRRDFINFFLFSAILNTTRRLCRIIIESSLASPCWMIWQLPLGGPWWVNSMAFRRSLLSFSPKSQMHWNILRVSKALSSSENWASVAFRWFNEYYGRKTPLKISVGNWTHFWILWQNQSVRIIDACDVLSMYWAPMRLPVFRLNVTCQLW